MTKYNSVNVKLSSSQCNNLESGTKNSAEASLNLSSNMIGNSNNETTFLHKVLVNLS